MVDFEIICAVNFCDVYIVAVERGDGVARMWRDDLEKARDKMQADLVISVNGSPEGGITADDFEK